MDSVKHESIGFATVTLVDAETGKNEKAGLSKESGVFELSSLQAKAYKLTISSMGYQPRTMEVNDLKQGKNHVNVGTILLSPLNSQLKEVAVTATKPLVKQEIDRVSYDVQADPESKAMTAMDMLRKVPLLSVDGDDNIQLQGSGDYRIFINGKPSPLLASNPKDVLRSMPANSILKIEVITTPPSKYDAEGLAGIINIITTKNTTDGYNGTINARYSNPWGPNTNISAQVKQGKFGFSGSAAIGHQSINTIDNGNTRLTYDPASADQTSTLLQTGTNTWGGNWRYGSGQISFEQDSLHLLTGTFNFEHGNYVQNYTKNSFFTDNQTNNQSYALLSLGGFGWRGVDLGLNYQLGFAHHKDELLTMSYQYSSSAYSKNATALLSEQVNFTQPNYNQFNNNGTKEHTAQIDYVNPLKKWNIEAGAKAIFRNNFSDFESGNYDEATDSFPVDLTKTNNFNYHQNVFGLYNTYQYKTDKWTFKAGARAEHTRVDANFISSNSGLNMNYTNVVPSISIMRSVGKNNSFTLGYTDRLQRPGIYQLNPFVDRSSNLQIVNVGNPVLKPVVSHLLEFGYNMIGKGSLNTKVSYMYANNNIENVTRVLSDTLSENTYDNVGHFKIARLNLSGSYPFTPKLSVNFNTGIFYVWINGYFNGQQYSNRGPRTNTYISGTYKQSAAWQFGAAFGYNRRYITLQGSSDDFYYTNFSITRNIKSFTITGVLNNPFAQYYSFTQYSKTPSFYQSNTSIQLYRSFNIGVSYKFGKLSSDIKKNSRGINNDDKSGN